MSATTQLGQISPMAYHTIMVQRVGEMGKTARLAEVSQAVSPFVSPQKEPGALTAKQQESNGDRERATAIVAQNGGRAFYEHFPPPPTSQEMNGFQDLASEVGQNIYQDHPVKTVPFGSQVVQAYQQAQSKEGLYVNQVKLSSIYA